MKKMLYLLPLFSLMMLAFQQPITDALCRAIKTGKFHAYNRKTKKHTIILRTDALQLEINPATKDTTFWKIRWLNNCSFSAEYIRGKGPKTAEELQVYKNSVLFFEIKEVTGAYYIGQTTVKAPNGSSTYIDTTWLKPR